MVYKDYYKILGLETTRVTLDEIKSAYRASAKKYHPDVNASDVLAEERIKDINEAYRVLSTPSSKRKYDRTWNANFYKEQRKNRGKESFLDIFLGNVNTSIKEEAKKTPVKGEDVDTEIHISIYDAFFGLEKRISLRDVYGKIKTFSVSVPKGMRNGEKIRLIGQGKPGENGGKNGDLFIKVIIDNDKLFRLEGCNLYTNLLLSPWEAALGSRVNLKTIDGETKVYIPQGIQSGEIIKIPQKGYQDGKGGRGDLIAEIRIMVPKTLGNQEKKLFEKLQEISKFNPRER